MIKLISKLCVKFDLFFFTDECDMKSNYVKCDTCKQAVHENAFENHRQDKKCTSITLLFRYDTIIEFK